MNHFIANMITDALCRYLSNRHRPYDFQYRSQSRQRILSCEYPIANRLTKVPVAFHIYDNGYNTYAQLPVHADPADPIMLYNVMTYINRVNQEIRDGNFEFDPKTGKIRFRYFMNCEDIDELSDRVIRFSISEPLKAFTRYGESFIPMIYSTLSKEKAFARYQQLMHMEMSSCRDFMDAFDEVPFPPVCEDAAKDPEEDPFADFDINDFFHTNPSEEEDNPFDEDPFPFEAYDNDDDPEEEDFFGPGIGREPAADTAIPRRRRPSRVPDPEPEDFSEPEEDDDDPDSLFNEAFGEEDDDFTDDFREEAAEIDAIKQRISYILKNHRPRPVQETDDDQPEESL